jgi:hypothetical protein
MIQDEWSGRHIQIDTIVLLSRCDVEGTIHPGHIDYLLEQVSTAKMSEHNPRRMSFMLFTMLRPTLHDYTHILPRGQVMLFPSKNNGPLSLSMDKRICKTTHFS